MPDPEPRYAVDQQPRGERRRLLERIPRGSTVLDVGCWSGYNGVLLQDALGCTVDGVEPDAAMAALAAARYRTVHAMTIEHALAGPLAGRSEMYDTIVLMDVLEHLVEPGAVLRSCRALARPQGQLVISLPNVAHWTVRKALLAGRWDYEPSGVLDQSHLRFFTFATARGLAQEAGLRIAWQGASLDRPPLVPLSGRARAVLGRWPGLFAAQILLELRR